MHVPEFLSGFFVVCSDPPHPFGVFCGSSMRSYACTHADGIAHAFLSVQSIEGRDSVDEIVRLAASIARRVNEFLER